MPDGAALIRPTGRCRCRPDKALMPPSGKSTYLNDKCLGVQALSGQTMPVVTVNVRACCGSS
ncbi:hypothetical protein DNI16_08795 [Salmonella enterica subsp. enterica]|uniref:Uncharacterized protein n=1 Tax=Salmonella ordonez TaxID=612 RepID=A0A5W5KJ53_SALOR|nr:hypothetical protein [Salmonella enterica]EBU8749686.1 hypothetical protein [Salmonella enterica subsp. enterica serovar Ordonez]EBX2005646.1 hypothetical protein [Salmonella enterica subsp. enterica serovar Ordonez]EBY8093596.1 hypothetical protein [Salmonella enterica subsp. enterica serovar Ordonez]MJL25914.1 hypothetical protein [Salmonella enterica subsp. enterica serovar Ordonez]